MKTRKVDELLNRYYKGETSLEEEAFLREHVFEENEPSPELDAFSFYEGGISGLEGLEEEIFLSVKNKEKRKRSLTRRIFSITSAAAVLLIALGVYLDFRDKKIREIENRFFVMEQAMYQVSERIRPAEQEEMLVLWVDDNVEIIIN